MRSLPDAQRPDDPPQRGIPEFGRFAKRISLHGRAPRVAIGIEPFNLGLRGHGHCTVGSGRIRTADSSTTLK